MHVQQLQQQLNAGNKTVNLQQIRFQIVTKTPPNTQNQPVQLYGRYTKRIWPMFNTKSYEIN